ncbi:glycosyltransferase family 61 protein [Desulfovibrio sp. OttesenSCG-928-G11]|nr:glycosyltransferase family 61 protein [Desulfovibrio sp. OttesenSCG-928-G11]
MSSAFTMVREALLMPFAGNRARFASGVFQNGVCLPASLQERAVAAKPLPPARSLAGNYIFGGYFFHHYGHFLLESLSRLYAVRQCKKLPLLFMSQHTDIPAPQREVLDLTGLDNEIIFISEPTLVESLIVSPPGAGTEPPWMLEEQMRSLGRFKAPPLLAGQKVWLSRSRFLRHHGGGGVVNEHLIDEKLLELGWLVVYPEQLPSVRDQIRLISSAEIVAGFDGSAFFNALLADRLRGRFIIFGRRQRIAPAVMRLLTQKGAAVTAHVPYVLDVLGNDSDYLYHLPDINEVLNVLRRAQMENV